MLVDMDCGLLLSISFSALGIRIDTIKTAECLANKPIFGQLFLQCRRNQPASTLADIRRSRRGLMPRMLDVPGMPAGAKQTVAIARSVHFRLHLRPLKCVYRPPACRRDLMHHSGHGAQSLATKCGEGIDKQVTCTSMKQAPVADLALAIRKAGDVNRRICGLRGSGSSTLVVDDAEHSEPPAAPGRVCLWL